MNYQEFKDCIKENIKNYLPEKYQEAEVEIQEITKNNNLKLDGLIVKLPEYNICPTIYINSFFKEYEEGVELLSILEEIADIRQLHDVEKNVSAEDFLGFERVKDSIVFKVVGAESNKTMLSDIPHRMENDMAIIYQILLKETDEGMGVVKVTNEIMGRLGMNEQTIHDLALENTQRRFPATFRSMDDVMKEIMRENFMGIDLNAISDGDDMKVFLESLLKESMEEMSESSLPMFVLTNECKINGAATLFYPDIKEQIAEQLGGDYFVLPSSLHEILVLPDDGHMTYHELKDMVNEVNQTQVSPDEVLTGEVYRYDKESKRLTLASEKREKGYVAVKVDDEKPSIMDTLRAKKQEVIHSKPGTKAKSSEMEL
ncbi:MAG: DUF5688 family protein [Lachnospiraceae bacterium]